jgi:hypothetical protein
MIRGEKRSAFIARIWKPDFGGEGEGSGKVGRQKQRATAISCSPEDVGYLVVMPVILPAVSGASFCQRRLGGAS